MLQPIYYEPGCNKSQSDYGAKGALGTGAERLARGRWIDMQLARFVAGYPEKIGGWTVAGVGSMQGTVRNAKTWRDVAGNVRMMFATDKHIYTWDGTTTLDVTPVRMQQTGNLSAASPLTTTQGSSVIAVADTSQQLLAGDWVYLNASLPVGGLTISGYFRVTNVTLEGYNITMPAGVTASVFQQGGGLVQFGYPRVTLPANPIAVTANSANVIINAPNHGAVVGDYVVIENSVSAFGPNMNGEWQIANVLSSNQYVIVANITSHVAGTTGGSTVSTVYPISIAQPGRSNVGYGAGGYGAGGYGGGGVGKSPPVFTIGWTLEPYGGWMLACPIGGTIYIYDPIAGGRGYPLQNAPTNINAMFVTPERFIMALGVSGNSLQMAWPDQSVPTQWTSLPSNTANSGRTLQGGAYFVGGIPVINGLSMFWSNRCTFLMQYTGDNEVYNTYKTADNSGLLSPWAVTVLAGVPYWWSDADLWMYNGAVQALPTDDVRDYIFRNINRQQLSKCWVGTVRAKREVWFGYCSAASTEIDSYVIYHTDQQCFSIGPAGSMPRTCWTDADLFPYPYAVDPSGNVYQQETGVDAAGNAMNSYVTGSPVDISNGDQNLLTNTLIADFQRQAGLILFTVNTKYYPQDSYVTRTVVLSPTDQDPIIDLREDGKMVSIGVQSYVVGGDWRLSTTRVDVTATGARR